MPMGGSPLGRVRQGLFTRAMWTGSAALALALASPVVADPGATALADWSRSVWSTALEGKTSKAVDLLSQPPSAAPELGDFAASIERYKANLAKREEARATRLQEVRDELVKEAAAGDLLKGLRAAIELYTLTPDKNSVLFMPEVRAMVNKAEVDAREHENKGRWLDAHALYNRLHLLYEEARTYEPDLRRLGQRLVMLRMYVPERLHEMRNQQRLAEGEDPLPPFNKIGEDWHEKLAKIDSTMVVRAIATAGNMHVDRVGRNKMLAGGFRALHTMLTTSDLSAAFPTLEQKAPRDKFLAHVDERARAFEERPDEADYRDLVMAVRGLIATNNTTLKLDERALLHEFANGAIGELDEFSSVIWPYEAAQFMRTTDGNFKGVGVQITLNDAYDLKVVTPLEGTPAARAGLRPNDIIRKVDGESTLGMSLLQAVDRITGPEGSSVILTIEREGVPEPIDFTLRRQVIPIYSVKGWQRTGAKETDWDWMVDDTSRIGYARITQFNSQTSSELRAAIQAMKSQNVRGLILDLRGNPGGLLSEAVNVASFFIDEGVVVTQEDNEGHERERQSVVPGLRLGHLPVVVLINGGSASASEIVSGALQDYHAAVIVGERSFGKGSVQNVFQLAADSIFKLTTQYYRLPGRDGEPGRLIHRRPDSSVWGIEPDVVVETLPQQFADAFALRQDADVVEFDAQGNLIKRENQPDPSRLIADGLDPQLETALLLIKSQVAPSVLGATARAPDAPAAPAAR
jgi:carboxyl-terminal processing protease